MVGRKRCCYTELFHPPGLLRLLLGAHHARALGEVAALWLGPQQWVKQVPEALWDWLKPHFAQEPQP